jgi:striatin 1/3/4
MPEAGKDFPTLNGINLMSGPSSAPASSGSQISLLERSNPLGSGMLQHPPSGQSMQQNLGQSQPPPLNQQIIDKDKDAESEGRQLTAIFRPDDAGEWKEKLRLSHEASEQARQSGMLGSGSAWDRRRDDDEYMKEDEGEVEDEETSVVGESEGNKVWKAKRTLRKSVT